MTRPVQTKQEVLDVLRAHEAELRATGIEHLDLFGSFARDEAGPESDVDLLASLKTDHRSGSWGAYDAEDVIARLLGREVDFITSLKPGLFGAAVCRELTDVF